jgi:hypothetical protein
MKPALTVFSFSCFDCFSILGPELVKFQFITQKSGSQNFVGVHAPALGHVHLVCMG